MRTDPSVTSDRIETTGLAGRELFVTGLVLAILVLSAFLRSAYLDWGIPGEYKIDTLPVPAYHPDEPVLINQVRELLQDPLHLSVFTYPPLQAQITAGVAWILGVRSTPGLYYLARLVSVVAAVLTVWFVWLIGRRWSRSLGLAAAAFMAVTMEACHQAHWANPESLCALGIVAGTWFCLRGPATGNFLWAGLCIGLSVGAKYFGLLFLHLPLAVGFCRGGTVRSVLRDWRKHLLFFAAVLAVVAVDMGYYLVARWDRFVEFVQTNSLWAHGRGLFGMHPAPVSPPSYGFTVLPFDAGVPLYLLGVTGVLLAILRHRRFLPLVWIPLPFYLFLETLNYKPPRFSLHLLPFLALLAALPIALWWDGGGRKGKWLAAALCVAVSGYSFAYAFSFVRCLDKHRDPRIQMERWVRQVGSESVALIGFDETRGRMGLCRYNHSIRLSGPPLDGAGYHYLIVPDILRHVLKQCADLADRGYRYTEDDWWPSHPPDGELLRLIRELPGSGDYRPILVFENKPEFLGLRMEVVRLPFSYFWLSNLRLDVYERVGSPPPAPAR